MNENAQPAHTELLEYQTERLQDLIREIVECCEDRKLYESQKFGLPYAQLKCLMLFNGERYLTVKTLAERLEVAKSRVTKLVSSLIEKGLVDRIEDPKDGRIKLLSLSPKGVKLTKDIEIFQRDIHGKILLQMSTEERRNMLSYVEFLHSAMEAVKEELV
jgi:DNA-binding MarR family transcriptional regulator